MTSELAERVQKLKKFLRVADVCFFTFFFILRYQH